MKKTFKYLVLVVSMLSVLCACGGGKLQPTTTTAVVDKIKEMGIYDSTDAYDKILPNGAKQVGGTTTNGWSYTFFDFGSDADSCDKGITLLDMYVETVDSETEGSNYKIEEGKGDGGYIITCRVDNTILHVWAPESDKNDVIAFAEDLGYYTK